MRGYDVFKVIIHVFVHSVIKKGNEKLIGDKILYSLFFLSYVSYQKINGVWEM